MEGLGRNFNVVPIADAKPFSVKDCSAVTFVCTGADTYTITVSDAFGGTYATPGNIIDHYYHSTATDGTAAWTRETQAAANAVTGAAGTTVIEVPVKALPDGDVYIQCASTSTGLVTAILHDLNVQRTPANLAKVGA